MDNKEKIQTLISKIKAGDESAIKQSFNDAIVGVLKEKAEVRKVIMAKELFKGKKDD